MTKNIYIFSLIILDKFPVFGNPPVFEPLGFCSDIEVSTHFPLPELGFKLRIYYLLTVILDKSFEFLSVQRGNYSTSLTNLKEFDLLHVKHLTQWQAHRRYLGNASYYHYETLNNLPSIILFNHDEKNVKEAEQILLWPILKMKETTPKIK